MELPGNDHIDMDLPRNDHIDMDLPRNDHNHETQSSQGIVYPANTQCPNNVVTSSLQRHNVAATL